MEGRVCHNPFAKFYEAGHDPLCPYIEETCPETGEKIQRRPKSVTTFINKLTDEEIGDYLTPDELKRMRAYKQPKDDDCGKEQREKEKQKEERVKVLETREVMWEQHAREQDAKIKKMEKDMEKLAGLLSQLISK